MVSEEEDIVYSVIEGGSESNRKAFESNAYSERDTFQCDSTIGLNLSNNVFWAVLYWSQHPWESSRAYGIPGGRNLHVQCLVRALMVIEDAIGQRHSGHAQGL